MCRGVWTIETYIMQGGWTHHSLCSFTHQPTSHHMCTWICKLICAVCKILFYTQRVYSCPGGWRLKRVFPPPLFCHRVCTSHPPLIYQGVDTPYFRTPLIKIILCLQQIVLHKIKSQIFAYLHISSVCKVSS